MAQIERTVVASGVIGLYNHDWKVIKLYDKKYDSECYHLYIHEEYISDYTSVVEALAGLVNIFTE